MRAILREKLIAQGLALANVSKLYQSDAQRLVPAYQHWLNHCEQDLSSLRSPISLTLQAERTSLLAVLDGLVPEGIQHTKSTRKLHRAAAARSIEKVSVLFQQQLEEIDRYFEQITEQLCQSSAIIQSLQPQLYASLTPTTGAASIWHAMHDTQETLQIYNYLSAKVSASDRNYLLQDLVARVLSNRSELFT
ncbi:MAG: hypothetical protein ACPG4U_03400 [Pseudomonadales bacterium]